MITNNQPLFIASRILKKETIQAILQSPSFHLQGWKILDRWAFNAPEKLTLLENQGELMLLSKLLEQQQIEHQILSSQEAVRQRQEGMMDWEILTEREIQTEL